MIKVNYERGWKMPKFWLRNMWTTIKGDYKLRLKKIFAEKFDSHIKRLEVVVHEFVWSSILKATLVYLNLNSRYIALTEATEILWLCDGDISLDWLHGSYQHASRTMGIGMLYLPLALRANSIHIYKPKIISIEKQTISRGFVREG